MQKSFGFGYGGIWGFVAPFIEKANGKEEAFYKTSKKSREAVARQVLKEMFPNTTRIDSLVISAFVTPLHVDGGITIIQKGSSLKGVLVYEDYEYSREDARLLYSITTKALNQ
jgi:hypothetical protein